MNSILDKMSLSDLILLKSKLEGKLLQKEQWVNGMRGWDDINKFNQRFNEFQKDSDHERIKIVNQRNDAIINFPLPNQPDSDLLSSDRNEKLKFDKETAEGLYRILCGLSRSCYENAEVYDEATPDMKKAYEKILSWGRDNCVDMRG